MLVALDLSDRSAALLQESFELAEACKAELHVVHVYRAGLVPTSRGYGPDCSNDLSDVRAFDAQHRSALGDLQTLMLPHDRSSSRGKVVVVAGDVATGIVETAKQLGASLLIIGRHTPPRRGGMALSDCTVRVLRCAECPVLVI